MEAELLMGLAGAVILAGAALGGLGISKAKAALAAKGVSDEQGDVGFALAKGVLKVFEPALTKNEANKKLFDEIMRGVEMAQNGWENAAVPTELVQMCKEAAEKKAVELAGKLQ